MGDKLHQLNFFKCMITWKINAIFYWSKWNVLNNTLNLNGNKKADSEIINEFCNNLVQKSLFHLSIFFVYVSIRLTVTDLFISLNMVITNLLVVLSIKTTNENKNNNDNWNNCCYRLLRYYYLIGKIADPKITNTLLHERKKTL